MSKPFQVLNPREYFTAAGEKKTHWMIVGSAFPSRNGDGGFDVQLHAVPAPITEFKGNDEKGDPQFVNYVRLKIMPPKEENPGGQQGGGGFGGGNRRRFGQPAEDQGGGDDIPF